MSPKIVCRIGIDQYSLLMTFDPRIVGGLIGFLVGFGKLGSDPPLADGFFIKSDPKVALMNIIVLRLPCTICLLVK